VELTQKTTMTITINTFDQLIEFIKANNLNVEQSKLLIEPCLNVLIIFDYPNTEVLIKLATDHWNKWKNYEGERPLFLDLDINVKD
jgi:hypothetical protein